MKQISLTLPKIGESVASATILKWFKKEGDMIALDEIFVEISTDKVDSELPSPYSGKLSKILIQAGEEAKVGQAICILEGEFKDSASHADSPQESSAPVSIASSGSNSSKRKIDVSPSNHAVVERGDVFLSPLVRKIVAKENLTEAEIQSIRGTGRHGRITQEDILNLLRNRAHHLEQLQHTPNQPSEKQEAHYEKSLPVDEGDEVVVFERMRQLIADHMLQSKRDSPHCTSFTEVDVTGVVDWRDAHKSSFEKEHGVKLTYTHVFMHCAIQALAEFPMLNAWNQKKGYILKKKINLGFATALPTGNLIVPNIKNCREFTLVDIAEQVNGLGQKAKLNQLQPDDIQGGTFTMSNTGIFGSLMGTPIINQPQVAILALGEILKKPAVIETSEGDVVAVRKKMFLSLSYDHRIIDGALGARFLKRLKQLIENYLN